MKKISGLHIFNSALRKFEWGSILFGRQIEDVCFSEEEPPANPDLWLVPGFIDIHMHIESSMTTPTEFSNVTAVHGTTTVVSDCHEIANAAGLKGLAAFMKFPSVTDIFYAVPSSVPCAGADIETANGSIEENEVVQLCRKEKNIIALGEIMNAKDLLAGPDSRTGKILRAFKKCRPLSPVEGHCPSLTGEKLSAFIAAGVDSDHTQQTPESIAEKTAKGMFLEIQLKSVREDIIRELSQKELAGKFCFCTDDVMPDVLYEKGQLDHVLRTAIGCGMKSEDVIYAATFAPAQRMRLFDRGMIAPGKISDFLILDDIHTLSIKEVWKNGEKIYDRTTGLVPKLPVPPVPAFMKHSVRRDPVTADNFRIPASDGTHRALVIHRNEDVTATSAKTRQIRAENGCIRIENGLNLIASVERYGHQEPIKPALIENCFSKPAAVCSSWAHDSHNLLVLATDETLAAQAVNLVIKNSGGIAAVDSESSFFVPLVCAGVVSTEPMKALAADIKKLRIWFRAHGFFAKEEIMNFAVLSLPVSPELRITCKGLVDVRQQLVLDWLDFQGEWK